jgi:dipeptidase E
MRVKTPRIVAIGGGLIGKRKAMGIDREAVRLTGKKRPRVLFVPTATGDRASYVDAFTSVYAGKLGCRVDALRLFADRPSKRRTAEMILGADLVYVGGGNTYRMMMLWRKLGVDRMLRKAAGQGVVMAGTSAGAICWFDSGHSDSRCKPDRDWDYIRVTGLGWIDATFCPHYRAEGREASLHKMIRRHGGVTIACDNRTAIEVVGDRWRVLAESSRAKVVKLFRAGGGVACEPLLPTEAFRPMSDLLKRGAVD